MTGTKAADIAHRYVETNNHIMQKCPVTHPSRIARHDSLMDYIRRLAEDRNHIVIPEWHIVTRDGTRKPDLIIITPDAAIVCEVTVTSDTASSLETARKDKIVKYDTPDVNSEIERHYPDRSIVHLPLVMTARGLYHNANDDLLRKLGSLSQRNILVARCMEGSIKIWKYFMRFVSA